MASLAIFGLIAAAGVAVMAMPPTATTCCASRMGRPGDSSAPAPCCAPTGRRPPCGWCGARDGSSTRDAFTAAGGHIRALFAFVRRGRENPAGEPRASLEYVKYRIVDGRLQRSARGAVDGAAPPPARVLIDGINRARVAYLSGDSWNDGWHGGATSLPEAVELELDLDGIGTVRQRFLLPGAAR